MTATGRKCLHAAAGAVSLAVFLLLWEGLGRALEVRPIMLPLPSQIALELAAEWRWYADQAWYTLMTTVAGFAVAVVGGVLIAVMLVSSRWCESFLYPLIVALNSVPKVAIAPLFVIWLGTGAEPMIAIAFLIAVFAVIVDTVRVFAALTVLAVMGMALFALLVWFERKATPWRTPVEGH